MSYDQTSCKEAEEVNVFKRTHSYSEQIRFPVLRKSWVHFGWATAVPAIRGIWSCFSNHLRLNDTQQLKLLTFEKYEKAKEEKHTNFPEGTTFINLTGGE